MAHCECVITVWMSDNIALYHNQYSISCRQALPFCWILNKPLWHLQRTESLYCLNTGQIQEAHWLPEVRKWTDVYHPAYHLSSQHGKGGPAVEDLSLRLPLKNPIMQPHCLCLLTQTLQTPTLKCFQWQVLQKRVSIAFDCFFFHDLWLGCF